MTIGAAIRITSPDDAQIIEHAAAFARQRSVPCFVFGDAKIVRRNLELISEWDASPVMQEGDNVAKLLEAARLFGVHMMFVGRTTAEELLHLDPPFDVVVVGSE